MVEPNDVRNNLRRETVALVADRSGNHSVQFLLITGARIQLMRPRNRRANWRGGRDGGLIYLSKFNCKLISDAQKDRIFS